MQEHTGLGKERSVYALAYSKVWNYTFHQDLSHHIAMSENEDKSP